jgi:LPS sulfotransferase NodH
MKESTNYYFEKLTSFLFLRFHELTSYSRSIAAFTSPQKLNFLIICDNRSGSTLLSSLLNNHRDIYCDDELFRPFSKSKLTKILFPKMYVEACASRNTSKIYGFDFKPRQLMENISRESFPRTLVRSLHKRNWKFIYLKRENIFKQSLSHMLAIKRQHWHDTPENPLKKSKIYVNCKKLIDTLEEYHVISHEIELVMSEIPHLEISYEQDLEDISCHQRTLSKIFSYLQVPDAAVQTTMNKVASHKWSDDVYNADEVMAYLRQSRYFCHLDN